MKTMECSKIQKFFQESESTEIPAELLAHTKSCPVCAGHLAMEKKILSGFQGLKHCPKPKNLAPRVLEKIAKERQAASQGESLMERLQNFFSDFGLILPLGVVALTSLIFVLWLHQGGVKPPLGIPSPGKTNLWEMSMIKGTSPIAGTGKAGPLILKESQEIELVRGSEAHLVLQDEAEVRLADARFIPLNDGLKILIGSAHVKVKPRKNLGDFSIRTPLGSVSVVGTEFSLEVTKEKLLVKVTQGTVRVTSGTRVKTLDQGQEDTFVPEPRKDPGPPVMASETAPSLPPTTPPSFE